MQSSIRSTRALVTIAELEHVVRYVSGKLRKDSVERCGTAGLEEEAVAAYRITGVGGDKYLRIVACCRTTVEELPANRKLVIRISAWGTGTCRTAQSVEVHTICMILVYRYSFASGDERTVSVPGRAEAFVNGRTVAPYHERVSSSSFQTGQFNRFRVCISSLVGSRIIDIEACCRTVRNDIACIVMLVRPGDRSRVDCDACLINSYSRRGIAGRKGREESNLAPAALVLFTADRLNRKLIFGLCVQTAELCAFANQITVLIAEVEGICRTVGDAITARRCLILVAPCDRCRVRSSTCRKICHCLARSNRAEADPAKVGTFAVRLYINEVVLVIHQPLEGLRQSRNFLNRVSAQIAEISNFFCCNKYIPSALATHRLPRSFCRRGRNIADSQRLHIRTSLRFEAELDIRTIVGTCTGVATRMISITGIAIISTIEQCISTAPIVELQRGTIVWEFG